MPAKFELQPLKHKQIYKTHEISFTHYEISITSTLIELYIKFIYQNKEMHYLKLYTKVGFCKCVIYTNKHWFCDAKLGYILISYYNFKDFHCKNEHRGQLGLCIPLKDWWLIYTQESCKPQLHILLKFFPHC